MQTLKCLSITMARKELLVGLIAHNLLRCVMAEAAKTQEVTLERISFRGAGRVTAVQLGQRVSNPVTHRRKKRCGSAMLCSRITSLSEEMQTARSAAIYHALSNADKMRSSPPTVYPNIMTVRAVVSEDQPQKRIGLSTAPFPLTGLHRSPSESCSTNMSRPLTSFAIRPLRNCIVVRPDLRVRTPCRHKKVTNRTRRAILTCWQMPDRSDRTPSAKRRTDSVYSNFREICISPNLDAAAQNLKRREKAK